MGRRSTSFWCAPPRSVVPDNPRGELRTFRRRGACRGFNRSGDSGDESNGSVTVEASVEETVSAQLAHLEAQALLHRGLLGVEVNFIDLAGVCWHVGQVAA